MHKFLFAEEPISDSRKQQTANNIYRSTICFVGWADSCGGVNTTETSTAAPAKSVAHTRLPPQRALDPVAESSHVDRRRWKSTACWTKPNTSPAGADPGPAAGPAAAAGVLKPRTRIVDIQSEFHITVN